MMKLVNWSGTAAVMGTLDMALHSIERVIDNLKDLLLKVDGGVIPNLDEDDDGEG